MADHSVPADSYSTGLPQPPAPPPPPETSRHRPAPVGYTPSTPLPIAVGEPTPGGAFAPSIFRAILCGIAGAIVGAAVWYALVVFTERQFVYAAIGLGLAIGYSVSWGAAKGGAATAVISAIIAGFAVVGAYYYITRHLIIAGGEELGIAYDIPLLPTFDELKIILRIGFEEDGSQYLYSGLCVAAAAFFGFKGITSSRGYTGKQVSR